MNNSDIILKVSKLSKNYDSFSLKNIDMCVKKGKITGFVGINGAGKTTVIKSIAGLVIPSNGNIELFGEVVNKSNESLLKNRMAFVLDGSYYYPDLTLNQMKKVVASAYSNWDEEIFKKYIKKFNLPLNKKIKTLSKGMKLQYSIALALSHHAELIVMDEPTSGLDPLVRIELMEIMKNLASNGISILFSSHITHDIEEVADDIAFIHDGEIVFQKDIQTIKNSYFTVEGNLSHLNQENEKLFLNIRKQSDIFIGIYHGVKSDISLALLCSKIESAKIEDIMFGIICGNKK